MGCIRCFFSSHEEGNDDDDVERHQDGNKESLSRAKLRLLFLEAISRGISLEEHTIGEVLWMLKKCIYRERTLLACAAQEPKLLPHQGMTKKQASRKMEMMMGTAFEEALKRDNEKRKRKGLCLSEPSKPVEQ